MKPFLKLLLLLLATALTGAANAQWTPPPPPRFETLDLPATNATTIVTGRIADFEQDLPDWGVREVTITVTENLKGEPVDSLKVQLKTTGTALKRWKAERAALLVALYSNARAEPTVIDLSDPDLAVLTADLRVLRKPDEVIDEVRRQVGRAKGPQWVDRFARSLPMKRFEGTPLTKRGNKYHDNALVEVPVDERLERFAVGEIAAKDASRRIEGIHALSNFKSERTIERLSPLLADEVGWKALSYGEGNLLRRLRRNQVRFDAYQALSALGAKVDEPVTKSPSDPDAEVVAVELLGSVAEAEVGALAKYPNLEEIHLPGARLTQAGFAAVARLKNLKSLFLEGTNVDDRSLRGLAKLPNLAYLALGNTGVTDVGLLELVGAKRLRKVDLGQRVTPQGVARLRRLRPGLVLREDEFAFLVPLKPRRVEQPINFGQNWQNYGGFKEGFTPTRRRYYALVFPEETSGKVDALVDRALSRRGWKFEPKSGRWTRARVPLGSEGGPTAGDVLNLFRVYPPYGNRAFPPYDLSNVSVKPGERLIAVGWNVDPR